MRHRQAKGVRGVSRLRTTVDLAASSVGWHRLEKASAQWLQALWERYGTLLILALLMAVVGGLAPQYFFAPSNIVQILLQSSITVVIAVAQLMVILTAGIDLSVGSVAAVTGLFTALMLVQGVPMVATILLGGLVAGAIMGLLNGVLVARTNLPPFIVTLGSMSVFRGVALIVSDGRPIYGLPSAFGRNIAGYVGPIPVPVIVALVIALIFHIVLTRTRFGRNVYAIGGNTTAAWLSGVDVQRHLVWVYTLAGLLAGAAGVIMTARLYAAEPLAGMGFELQAIAATVIGGTSFFGGVGTVFGTVVGALIMGVIMNALNLLNIQTYYQQVVTGVVIVTAVLLNQYVARKGIRQ